MNSFKDFKKVLNKHETISSAYKKVLKYSIISTSIVSALLFTYFFYPKTELPKKEFSPTLLSSSINKELKEDNQAKEPEEEEKEKNNQTTKIPSTSIKKIRSEESSRNILTSFNPEKEEPLTAPNKLKKSEKEILTADSSSFENKESIDVWYTLNSISEVERIRLPTLMISRIAWPDKLNKSKFIKSPSIKAIYKSLNREIPIVDGMAYITTNTAQEKPHGYKLGGNNFSPGLIREIHKTNKSCILLLKNIEVFIPGRGRINIGDQEIKIDANENRF